jgi:hypothetical protein
MAQRFWSRLNPAQRAGLVVLATAQIGLALTAAVDLARRPRDAVNGPKWRWAAVLPVNFLGPLAYLRWGRRRARGLDQGPTSPDGSGAASPNATAAQL